MAPKRKVARGRVAEGVGFRLNEGPLRPPALPFTAMYLGEGVVTLDGFGTFARFTRAEVDAATAARLEGDPAWELRRRSGGPLLTEPAPGAPDGAS